MNIAGVDEVGRGPLSGPVVACAVILTDEFKQSEAFVQLDDSKKLGVQKRQVLAETLKKHCCWSIAQASVSEIDYLNILQATLLAMHRAVAALTITPEFVKVDGNRLPDWHWPAEAIIGGDKKVPEISAASIIAKVYRDALMAELAKDHPGYGWEKNAGYATTQHLQALTKFGVTPHHRRSFAPVAQKLACQRRSL